MDLSNLTHICSYVDQWMSRNDPKEVNALILYIWDDPRNYQILKYVLRKYLKQFKPHLIKIISLPPKESILNDKYVIHAKLLINFGIVEWCQYPFDIYVFLYETRMFFNKISQENKQEIRYELSLIFRQMNLIFEPLKTSYEEFSDEDNDTDKNEFYELIWKEALIDHNII